MRNLPNNKVGFLRRPLCPPPPTKSLPPLTEQVEGEVQGDEAAIAAMLQKLDRGPSMARVVRLDKEDREVVEADVAFEIRH